MATINPWVKDVIAFHEGFGVPVRKKPIVPPGKEKFLRQKLVRDEHLELQYALEKDDIVEIADAIADLLYVAIGTALAYGIPIDRVWKEVHASNMRKIGGRRSREGKILKPKGWKPPDIERALQG